MEIKLIELDGRHNGFKDWKYYVKPPITQHYKINKQLFFNWREWCWKTWGPSKELTMFDNTDLFDGVHSSNAHWCWLNDEHGRCRIYLKTDEDASAFILNWS